MKAPFVKYSFWLWLISAILQFGCRDRRMHGLKIFHYNEATGIASLDPAFSKNQSVMWAVHQLYNQLVEVDAELQIKPSLAASWTIDPTGTVYQFTLRHDVFFHDNGCFPNGKGRRMVARDVEYSFRRLMDPRVASPGTWIFNGKVDSIQPFLAVNDSVFQLRLLKPYSPILGILSMQYCSIVPSEAVEKYGPDFRRQPVGTGPFRFVAWEEGLSLLLHRHDRYFETDSAGRRLPLMDGVKVSFYDSKATEFLLFRQGKLDFINDIEASFRDEVLTKRGTLKPAWEGKINMQKHAYLNTEYLGILVDTLNPVMNGSSLRMQKVRQAINYGFDRAKMVLYLRNSIGTPATSGFVPAGMPSFDSSRVKGYTYDPRLARQLLVEAGFPGGKGLAPIKLLTIPIYSDLASFIAGQLAEIGIPVQVEVIPKALLLEMTATSRAPFFRASWIADYPDAENYLSVFYSKNPAPPNYTRFNDPTFDRIMDQAMLETNDSVRNRLYQAADQRIIEMAPVVPLWYDQVIHLVQPGIKGFEANSLNLLELRKASK
ncbi:MAG: ABC transporter substrate-binding protein [Chitinophagaceae bacterium]|nr:ABC transporter substrate-binding protein [Chitinophagaceae bacterium]